MKVIVAKNIGFCMGVERALDIAKKSLEKDPKPVYFLGEIIHNEKVMKEMKKKGGRIISNPKQAKSGTLVIRAHGTPPLPPLKNIFIEDATCLLVKKAQKAAQILFKEGYKVIIVGDKKHPEVKGILGNINNKAIVIKNEAEAKKLKKFERLGVVAQTTQNLIQVNKILDILKKKAKKIRWINTLCPQVSWRQKELLEIIKKTDGILVVGSPTSANTNQLVRTVQLANKSVWLANSLKDVKNNNFKKVSGLGIVSGTSAPNWIIEEIKRHLLKTSPSLS